LFARPVSEAAWASESGRILLYKETLSTDIVEQFRKKAKAIPKKGDGF
jgi:hypothetical protein